MFFSISHKSHSSEILNTFDTFCSSSPKSFYETAKLNTDKFSRIYEKSVTLSLVHPNDRQINASWTCIKFICNEKWNYFYLESVWGSQFSEMMNSRGLNMQQIICYIWQAEYVLREMALDIQQMLNFKSLHQLNHKWSAIVCLLMKVVSVHALNCKVYRLYKIGWTKIGMQHTLCMTWKHQRLRKKILLEISVRRWQNINRNRNLSHKPLDQEGPLVLVLLAFHHSWPLVLEIFVRFLIRPWELSLVWRCLWDFFLSPWDHRIRQEYSFYCPLFFSFWIRIFLLISPPI